MSEDDPFRGLLYVMDSLRYDHLGCNGYEKDITPKMDNIAADGTSFDNAFSQAIWTYPSAGSIFTGLYPETHDSQQFHQGLDSDQPHLADRFGEEVSTACFSTTLGVSPDRGYKQEFDEFYHLGEDDSGLRPDIMGRLNEKLLPWLESNADGGFFVVIWAMGTHHPYLPPSNRTVSDPTEPVKQGGEGTQDWMRRLPADRREDVISTYDRAIKHTDEKLGEVIDCLKDNGVYDETAVFVTADHGELFDEHARLEHASKSATRAAKTVTSAEKRRYFSVFDKSAFVGHQAVLPYDELIHVPLIVKPDVDNDFGTDRHDGLVELIDLFPTLYEFADLDAPSAIQGRSLSRSVNNNSKSFVYSTSQIHNGNLLYRSIRGTEYKLCTKELFDISPRLLTDIRTLQSIVGYFVGEGTTLLQLPEEKGATNKKRASKLMSQLESHISDCESQIETSGEPNTVTVDEETQSHLEDLGYK
ncbi:sulfatase [Haloarcula sp. JP-Z28]|uniref:sulfatase n=1 Tax=Haloarcula sp. JP-Z28 TaxID=2716715 RepID=UPI0014044CA9|nr:sulfatase [Haloarcula sp. JP-Z28]NHN65059.1 sulfatase [Haloarcula sp. JP-Z28]